MINTPALRPGSRLQSFLSVQPGEGARVLVMILYSAAAIGGVLTVGTTVSDTLFISALPASAFAYMLILPAISIIPALLLYNRIAARFRLERVIVVSNVLLLGGLAAFRFLLATPAGKSFAVLAALYLFVEVAYTLVILQFWSLAGLVFNPREARRLFGLITAGGTFANIVAGLSLAAVVNLIGVENLLWLVVMALAVCIVCVWRLKRWVRQPASKAAARSHKKQKSLLQDLRAIRQTPLLVVIGCLTLLVSLLINIGGYEFWLSLQINFAGRARELATYLGAFHFIGGLAGFVVQSYLSGRIMNRFGIFAALAFLPVSMALGGGLSLLAGGALWAMTILRISDPIFRRTINSAALNVLYLPTPEGLRERAKELFEGLYAAAFGLAGVVALFLQNIPGWNFLYYSIPLLALSLAWLALLPWARRHYTAALAASLKRRVLDLEGATINISDETTVRVLIDALRHPDESYVVHALQLISGAPAVNWDVHVAPLLQHPSPAVRIKAAQHLGRPGNDEYAHAISTLLLNTDDQDVRAAAIESLYTIMVDPDTGSATVSYIAPFLNDPYPRIKSTAIVGLLKYGDPYSANKAAAELKRLAASEDKTAKQEAARVIGLSTSTAELQALLVPLFDDDNLEVRLSAIRAASALNNRDLLPHLLRKLNDKSTTAAAVEALAKYRDEIESDLSAVLDGSTSEAASQVPRVLQERRTRSAAEALLTHFYVADDAVRSEVYRALARLRADGLEFYLSESDLREAIAGELRGGYMWVVIRADLGQEGLDLLLSEAVQTRLSRAIDRVFYLLNLLYPNYTQQIQRVRQALEAGPGNTRALAVELLDTLSAAGPVKELLLPLVEAPAEKLLDIAGKRFGIERRPSLQRLRELAEGPDLWLRACAVFRIGVLKQAELAGCVLAALASEDALLRETALAASRLLFDAGRYHELLAAHAQDGSPVVSRYVQSQIQNLKFEA
ncbi:MAG: MFS transporter [Chloroflexi bacterium]|nr:MFS transporter [Chloroflexota bacterium]